MSVSTSTEFLDRREQSEESFTEWVERRQFAEAREMMPADVRELAEAIDAYKVDQGRRHITLAEVLEVFKGIGYHR